MSGIEGTGLEVRRKLWLSAAVLFLVTGVLSLGMAKGPIGLAQADVAPGNYDFCTKVTLQPLGKSGDRCGAGHAGWGHLLSVNIHTYERAGCVNYVGYYGELYRSWTCVPNNTYSYIVVPNDGGSYSGIIRNNNLSYSGKFSGVYSCCWTK